MAAAKRLNVLVYAGNGSTIESVRHCVFTLRRLLSPNYAVLSVQGDALTKEPWTGTCALLVFPGGADLPWCRTLNGEGNRRIKQYVERGGLYLGFCAGGYYGSSKCEFEVGNPKLEVVGDRELKFFPGTCRGLAFPGFVYHSELGARAVELKVDKTVLKEGAVPDVFSSYYNGGGVFVDAGKYKDQGVEVVASYTQKLNVDSGEGTAAVVYCKVEDGAALLTGPHPEFAPVNLDPKAGNNSFPEAIRQIEQDDKLRTDFLKACLRKLGLRVNEDTNTVPSLSRLHLTSYPPSNTSKVIDALRDIITTDEEGEEYIKDENDTFHLEKPSAWKTMGKLKDALPDSKTITTTTTTSKSSSTEGGEEIKKEGEVATDEKTTATDSTTAAAATTGEGEEAPLGGDGDDGDRILDYNDVLKRLVVHDKELPTGKETPYFNHHAYFANLKHYQEQSRDPDSEFGKNLLYGEVVTSTNTLLEKNTQLLRRLPAGFVATATVQVAGRGRGSNVWVSPAGSLMFSLVTRHEISLMKQAPVVFLQYIAALAIVEGIKSYDEGRYERLPVKLKWPNDIYALDPALSGVRRQGGSGSGHSTNETTAARESYVKIGGILVNSHYSDTEFLSVTGIGLNTTNALPTTSLTALLSALAGNPNLPAFTLEKLLARIVTTFDAFYTRFRHTGFDEYFEKMYYRHWLHTEQIVTLETEGGMRARIKGISRDWGLLVAEELGWEDRPTGRLVQLQSDSNSFDFFRGLLKRKI
ncbi:biotin holocarboxylase synthetase [Agyrium rufum]|nr:biotin holocarboxylase synthetase [Agyrium rufum]